jgi:hypothetical protein
MVVVSFMVTNVDPMSGVVGDASTYEGLS